MKRILLALLPATAWAQDRPNVIWLMADDLGYGDLSCYGATSIHTPNIDRVAQEGVRFTDMHACASTSTPSRYGILTENIRSAIPEPMWRREMPAPSYGLSNTPWPI